MSQTNNFKNPFPSEKNILNNNFISGKTENFTKTNNDFSKENFNKTYSNNTNLRKSFNCDEYLNSLRLKLGNTASK